MTIHQIRCFLAIAKYLNFTQAANSLYTSQSAISKQITSLEKELGFPLFVRSNKYVRLTPAGVTLIKNCNQALDYITMGIDMAMNTNEGYEGQLSIGCCSALNYETYLPEHISRFKSRYSNINVKLESNHFDVLNHKLFQGELDIIYSFKFHFPPSDPIVFNHVRSGTLVILMHKNHPMANKEQVSFLDFKFDTFISPISESLGEKYGLNTIKNHYQITCLKTIDVPNFETMFLYIRLGLGVALVDDSLLAIHDPSLVSKPFSAIWDADRLSVIMAWDPRNLNPALPLYTNLYLK